MPRPVPHEWEPGRNARHQRDADGAAREKRTPGPSLEKMRGGNAGDMRTLPAREESGEVSTRADDGGQGTARRMLDRIALPGNQDRAFVP